MMEQDLLRLLPYFLGGMFALGVLLFLLALHQIRRRRTGSYWRVRRRAGERGGRLFLLSVGLIFGSLILTLISGLAVLAFRPASDGLIRGPEDLYGIVLPSEPAQTATREAMETFEAARAETRAVLTLTAPLVPDTPTPQPTPTDTALPPTGTPTEPPPTATNTLLAPAETLVHSATNTQLPSPTTAPTSTPTPTTVPSYRLTIDSVSVAFVAAAAPPPMAEFPAGTRRFYVYISFEGMSDGAEWSRVLYRDSLPIQANTLRWSLGESGRVYFFFENEAGYVPGAYELRLYVDEQEASRYDFTVQP